MNYHPRLIEEKLAAYSQAFPCVLVTGARQVGKSTLLQKRFGRRTRMFTFDPVQDLYGEKTDPELFLRNNPPPLILDEIQYVPDLVPAIKRCVDAQRRPGMFLISGSQQWAVMRRLAESLAGRVAVLDLSPFSLSEARKDRSFHWFPAWLESALHQPRRAVNNGLKMRSGGMAPAAWIWRGGFPQVASLAEAIVPGWMQGYVATYLQRDVRLLLDVRNETLLASFLGLCATLTAQECNYRQMGRDIGLSAPTAQTWLRVLKDTFLWVETPAYSRNAVKRLSSKPKGYLADTGLACYLMRLSSPRAVMGHPCWGALFESAVVLELVKQAQTMKTPPIFYHYRRHSGAEIDLLVEWNGVWFPVEIKSSATVRPTDATSIGIFREEVGAGAGPGLIVYAGREPLRLTEDCLAVPFDARIESEK